MRLTPLALDQTAELEGEHNPGTSQRRVNDDEAALVHRA